MLRIGETSRAISAMAADPKRKMVTVVFPGGWARGAKGLMDYLFDEQIMEWAPVSNGRRPYGSRQRANAAAGEVMFVDVAAADTYTVRISSTQTQFLRELISRSGEKIDAIWSERGTIYTRRPRPVQPAPKEVEELLAV